MDVHHDPSLHHKKRNAPHSCNLSSLYSFSFLYFLFSQFLHVNASEEDIYEMQHSTLSQDSSLVGSIRNDETQLRTLVVVLSLTGGLVLAFFLGFGIFLYWHCVLKTKQSDQEKALNNKVKPIISDLLSTRSDLSSRASTGYKPRTDMHQQARTIAPSMPVVPSSSPALQFPLPHIDADSLVEPICPPSAPTAKELESTQLSCRMHQAEYEERSPGASGSVAGVWQSRLMHHPHSSSHSLCPSVPSAVPDAPPPAYTPKEY